MAKRNIFRGLAAVLALGMCMTGLAGCGNEKRADGKTEIEVVSYKPEAVKAFEKIEKRFNETHDDIHLTISSPNEAMTILKTRFIREDYPDIIAIGGDINYSNFLDADLFEDISGLDEVQTVKQAYLAIGNHLFTAINRCERLLMTPSEDGVMQDTLIKRINETYLHPRAAGGFRIVGQSTKDHLQS